MYLFWLFPFILLLNFVPANGGDSGDSKDVGDVGGGIGGSIGGIIGVNPDLGRRASHRDGGGEDDLSSALSELDLAPLPGFAFTVYGISAISLAPILMVAAIGNMFMRKQLRSSTGEHDDRGPIFPAALSVSAISFCVYIMLNLVRIGRTENRNIPQPHNPNLSDAFFRTLETFGYLNEVGLTSCGLAVLAQVDKVLATTPKIIRQTKTLFDTALAVALLALSMTRVGWPVVLQSRTESNIYLAYRILLLVAAVDIAISYVALHIRAKRKLGGNNEVTVNLTFYLATIVSSLHVLYALLKMILWGVKFANTPTGMGQEDVVVALVVCIFVPVLILSYFGFDMPHLPKKDERNEGTQNV